MKYYKVVHVNNNKIMSALNHQEWTVEYKVGEWVYPKLKQSPLMVFNNIKDAKRFISPRGDWYNDVTKTIYECEIKPFSRDIPKKLIACIDAYKCYWTHFAEAYISSSHKVPDGTVFADAVKLVKKIMTKEEALKEIGKYEPCPHFAIDTGLGNGKIWARCDDCGQVIFTENLDGHRKSNERFLEALEVLKNAS